MNSIWIAIQVILPLFMLIALGYGLRRLNFLNKNALNTMNDLTFHIFIPVLIFVNIYNSSIENVFNGKLILFAFASIVLLFGFLCKLLPHIEKDIKKQSVLVQGIFRANFVIFSIPIVTALFPEHGAGTVSLLVAFMAPVFNGLSVGTFEIFRGKKISTKNILFGILKNPQIIGSFFGIFMLLAQWELPVLIERPLTDLSKITTPFALIVLGGSFLFAKSKDYVKQIFIGVCGKLILVPIVFLSVSVALGFRGAELASLMVLFASPVAVSSFSIAEKMGGDGDLAAQLVVWTSVLSIATMCIWIVILKQGGCL